MTEPVDMRHAAPGVALVGGPSDGWRFHSETVAEDGWPTYLSDNAVPLGTITGLSGFLDGYGYRYWMRPEAHGYIHASIWPTWRKEGEVAR